MGKRKKFFTPTSNIDKNPLSELGLDGISDEVFQKAETARKERWEEIGRQYPWVQGCRDGAIRAIVSDETARESYFRLLKAGFTQCEILQLLIGMAVFAPRKGKAPNWLRDLGMATKTIKYRAKQINKLAAEIEKLNKHPLLIPETWIHCKMIAQTHSNGFVDKFGKLLMGLPFLLRSYAKFIDGQTKYLREHSRSSFRNRILAILILAVRKETGRPRYGDLSLLLAATAREAGLADSDCVFDAPTLKMLVSRMTRKQTLPQSP